MIQHRTGDEPLSKPMITQFNEPYPTVHAYVVGGIITGCEWKGKVGQDVQWGKTPTRFSRMWRKESNFWKHQTFYDPECLISEVESTKSCQDTYQSDLD